MLPRLDKKDLEVLRLYSQNPDIPQEEVAKTLGVSQPSIAVRLRRLKATGLLAKQVGLDLFKAGLHLAKVDITTVATTKVLKMFEGCPYFLNGLITSGKSNLCLFFMAEDVATLEAIVDNHIRALKEVQSVDFNIVIGSTYSVIAPLRTLSRARTQPCGAAIECRGCASFIDGRCTGCPVTNQYRGILWSTAKP